MKEGQLEVMERWIKEYGKVFGYFIGEMPYLMITDTEMVKQCFVKEANIFHDRPQFAVDVEPFASSLLALRGKDWKKVRTVLNPSFSASKMKMMMHALSTCTDEMLEVLDEYVTRGDVVDMHKVAQGLSLHVIGKCALAWQVDCQKNPRDPLLLSVREFFAGTENVAFETAVRFPFIKKIIEVIYPCTNFSKVTDRISKNIRRVIEIRRKGERPQATDMLQLMLDAQAGSESRAGDHRKNDLLIEDHHLLSNCFIFLLAGFETTATSLGFIMHLLAMHYDEQQRIFDELSAVFPEKDQEDRKSVV